MHSMREGTLPGKTNDIEELLPGHYGGHDEFVPGLGGVVLKHINTPYHTS